MSKITRLEQQRRNKDRVNVFIGEVFAFGIHKDLIVDFNLYVDKEVDEKEITKLLQEEEQKKANSYAMNLLSFRIRSERELRKRMKEKEYEDELIDKTIELMKRYKFLDDRVFAEMFVRDKMNFNKYGVNRLKQELYLKGIDKEIIEETIGEYVKDDEEFERALETARKQIRSYRGEDRQKIYRKLGAYLQRKGFRFDVIKPVLNQVMNQEQ